MHAIVEMMGHRKFGAKVEERELAGVKLLHCTVLAPQGSAALGEQWINPSSLYALTPCGEDVARKANADSWRLREAVPSLPAPVVESRADDIPFDGRVARGTDEVSLDAEVTTREGLARWLHTVAGDMQEIGGGIEGVSEAVSEELEELASRLEEISHGELVDMGLAPGCVDRGAPFGDDTVGSGADDEEDEPEYQWSIANPPDVGTVVETLVLVHDFGCFKDPHAISLEIDPEGEARFRAAVEAWGPAERFHAWRWAACEHVAASDNEGARRYVEPECVKTLRAQRHAR